MKGMESGNCAFIEGELGRYEIPFPWKECLGMLLHSNSWDERAVICCSVRRIPVEINRAVGEERKTLGNIFLRENLSRKLLSGVPCVLQLSRTRKSWIHFQRWIARLARKSRGKLYGRSYRVVGVYCQVPLLRTRSTVLFNVGVQKGSKPVRRNINAKKKEKEKWIWHHNVAPTCLGYA